MNKILKILIGCSSMAFVTPFASANNLCSSQGYAVGFFNGVANSSKDAKDSLLTVKSNITPSLNKPIIYELFYNQTNGLTQDIQEVFRQRASEFKDSHYEILTAIRNGNVDLLNKLVGLYPESEKEISELKREIDELKSASIVELADAPLTSSDYENHNEKLMALAGQNKQLLLVAHSQGNLFMNYAYDHILPIVTKSDIQAVHIAPASQTLRGHYILSDNDYVINGLRYAYGDESVPSANVSIPFRWSEFSGHALVDTYLNQKYQGHQISIGMIQDSLQELSGSKSGNNTGLFRASISSVSNGEIRLYVAEPEQANPDSYYRYYSESGLWIDSFRSSCESDEVEGRYSISFKNFDAQEGSIGTLTVSNSKGLVIGTKQFDVGSQDWREWGKPPVHIADVVVSKSEDGKSFDVTLN